MKRLIVFAIAILVSEIATVVDLEIGSDCIAKRSIASEGMGDPGSDNTVSYPRFHLDAIYQTPDISQKKMANDNFCAPCAAANLLYQFHRRGFVSLPRTYTGPDTDESGRQKSIRLGDRDRRLLAETFGGPRYMDTAAKNGTNRYRLINGLDRFIRQQCRQNMKIEYIGLREFDVAKIDSETRQRMGTRVQVPKLDHLKESLSRGRGVLILFGSYKPNRKLGNRLERLGGHYVIVVGYGANVAGDIDESSVLLHDSNDDHLGVKFINARKVRSATELWSDGELLARSDEFVRLERAPIRKDGRIAFLETVLSFRTAD